MYILFSHKHYVPQQS